MTSDIERQHQAAFENHSFKFPPEGTCPGDEVALVFYSILLLTVF